jgi:hypothetical protein
MTKNICLCFCVRNCEKHLPGIFTNIECLRTKLHGSTKVYSIFVYDNCSDNSEILLNSYQNDHKDEVILRTIANTVHSRTERIANARNACLEIVYSQLNDISFHMMIDSDERCSSHWNIDIITNYLNNFDNDDWDCISFNRVDYYDIWALMYDDFKEPCWGVW